MDFSNPYLLAMRDQAPQMVNQLRRAGELDAHLKEKSAEAHRLYDDLAKGKPKLPGGLVEGPSNRREIEEQVFAQLVEFPPELSSLKNHPLEPNLEETPTRATTLPSPRTA